MLDRNFLHCCRIMAFAQERIDFKWGDFSARYGGKYRGSEEARQICTHQRWLLSKTGPLGGYVLTLDGKAVDAFDIAQISLVKGFEWTLPLLKRFEGVPPSFVVQINERKTRDAA